MSMDKTIRRLWQTIGPNRRFAFFGCFLAGYLGHLYAFTNLIPNSDGLSRVFDLQQMTVSGRWFLHYASALNDFTQMPALIGFLSVLFLSLAAALTVDLLGLNSRTFSALAGAAMALFPCVGYTFLYMFTASAYSLAIFLAVLSVWLAREGRVRWLLGALALAVAMGTYQAYATVAISLSLLIVLGRVLDKEKSSCRMIYQEGIISKDSFVRLMASLDEMYDHDGEYALSFRQSIFNFCEQAALLHHLRSLGFMRDWISFYFRERIMIIYDLGRGFIILQREDLKFLDDLASSDLVSEEQKRLLAQLKEEITENINKMNEVIQKLAQEFPRAYHHALTQKSIRMLLSDARRPVNQLTSEGILSDKDAEQHMESINKRIDEVNSFSHTIPASLFRWMIHKKKQEKPKK